MLNPNKIISGINNSCKIFFTESSFYLQHTSTNRFKITGNNNSKAINKHNNGYEEVTVIKWFDSFWIYIEIRFEKENTFISISIFQGESDTLYKNQLFRAEWDDFNNIDEKHPQPHWHITANQVIENTLKEIAKIDDTDTFVGLLNEEKQKVIDINKIHFAMNGNWINNESHIHKLNNEAKIINWFQGLLNHLRVQLEYVL